jgi:hypothetical protein
MRAPSSCRFGGLGFPPVVGDEHAIGLAGHLFLGGRPDPPVNQVEQETEVSEVASEGLRTDQLGDPAGVPLVIEPGRRASAFGYRPPS